MPARNEGEGLVEVSPKFVRGSGPPKVMAGDGEAAAEGGGAVFEPGYIIALPAMEGDGEAGQGAQGTGDIHVQVGVALAGEGEGLFFSGWQACHGRSKRETRGKRKRGAWDRGELRWGPLQKCRPLTANFHPNLKRMGPRVEI